MAGGGGGGACGVSCVLLLLVVVCCSLFASVLCVFPCFSLTSLGLPKANSQTSLELWGA